MRSDCLGMLGKCISVLTEKIDGRKTIRKTMVEIQKNPFRGAYEVPNRNGFYRYSSAHEILYTVEDQTCMIKAIRWKDRMY